MMDSYTRLLEIVAQTEDKKISDDAVSRLILHLKSRGRMKMLSKIARELKKVAIRRQSMLPVIEVANGNDKLKALSEAHAEGFSTDTVRINTKLIRGWRARKGGTLVDRSAKRALIDIYTQAL